MRLAFADPRNMTISALNMNHGRTVPEVADLLPSVRQRGVLLTLLVLETVQDGAVVPDHFEVVAGARRLTAAQAVIAEGVEIDPVPIAILEPGDDAAALEASLIENLNRLPPDEVTCWETFNRLIRTGRTPEQIAATFGMSDVVVKRTLALGNLMPRIRGLYRKAEIDVATVRALTLATRAQQKAWLALLDDPEATAPSGSYLKAWLFGGSTIPVKNALFPLEAYAGEVVADLFGEETYFADTEQFWTLQNEWLALRVEAWLAEGWAGVEVLEVGHGFYAWNHDRVGKAEGGRIFVEVSPKGEATFHEGYLTRKEAQRLRNAADRAAEGEDGKAARAVSRSELTSAQETYIDLHRLAAARLALVEAPAVALRLLLAHALAGAAHWRVDTEGRHGVSPALAESLAANAATAAYGEHRAAAARQLGLDPEARDLVGRRPDAGASGHFARLLSLGDAEVLRVAAVVMAESLAAGSAEVEAAGAWLKVDMAEVWAPDAAFFDLIRDRETVNAMLKEVGGKRVADGNLTEKVKTQKAIIQDYLAGANDRPKVDAWTPRWMAFPAAAYTRRPCAPAARARSVAPLLKRVRPAEADPVAIAAE